MDFKPEILVVDDEQVLLDSIAKILTKSGLDFDTAVNGKDCKKAIESRHYDLVLLDLALPDIPGIKLLEHIVRDSPGSAVVIITGHATLENAVKTLKMGATDFLAKPFTPNELRAVLEKVSRQIILARENELLRRKVHSGHDEQIIVGNSRLMRKVLDLVEKVAPTDSTVLITGESGTGKEIIARAIHEKSTRQEKEFVPIDCTSLVETLLESELFGHVKGSFTGAMETKHGYFELASGGSMFFDEVGNLPMAIQAKLLRALQSQQISPVGSTRVIQADVRILAATNKALPKLIREGKFREDLFYRLNVVPITLPPLRKRPEDIPLLVQYFLDRYNKRRSVPVSLVSAGAMDILKIYNWPGNVRELENTIERALILVEGNTLKARYLPVTLADEQEPGSKGNHFLALSEVEKEHIKYVLKLAGNNRSKAARILKIDRKTLYNKMDRYGIK